MSLFAELNRRNVFRVTAAYLVLSWLLLQVADVVFDFLSMPDWSGKLLLIFLAIGFVPAIVFSWAYELTPEGVKRERDVDRSRSITRETAKKLDVLTITLLLTTLGVVVLDRFVLERPAAVKESGSITSETAASEPKVIEPDASTSSGDDRASVAVLPFVNMSDDPSNEYFSDGISEELLNVLVNIESLRVPSRTSSFRFKGADQAISDIGKALGVDHVLEGSVRKAGNQVRITAQLIDVDTDTHLWSETYTRTLDDIFSIQDEIANAIVEALKVTLGAGETVDSRDTGNVDAYNHYLKGRFFWHQRTREGFAAAEKELQQAVELDPGYADAWAGLADVYVLQPEYGWASSEEAVPKARAAVERALSLNPDSARALTTRAYLRFLFDWDWENAEADFRRAIEIEPEYATARQWYAEMLAVMRRFEEAEASARRAVELDPLAPVMPMVLGNILRQAGRLEESAKWLEESLRLSPGWFNALGNLAATRVWQGRYQEARELQIRAAQNLGFPAEVVDYVVAAFDALAGTIPREQAVQIVSASPYATCQPYDRPYSFALLGEYDLALDDLERCFDQGTPYITHMNNIRVYEPMREIPRFRALLAKMNLLESEVHP